MPPAAIAVDAVGPRPQVPLTPGAPSATGALTIGLVAAPPAPPPPTITTIDRAETDALLARLEPLPDVTTRPAPIVRPPATPPVRAQGAPVTPIAFVAPTGTTVADKPASSQPNAVRPAQPLVVPEVFPRGPTSADATIRVRFDEPMVPIARAGEVAGQPPVTLVPAVAGTWRWLDTRVLEFQTTAKRFPMATSFTITVPAGTHAVSGNLLVADVVTTFTTNAPQIVEVGPGRVRTDEPVFVRFDQDVDPAAIAPFLEAKIMMAKSRFVKHAVTVMSLADAKLAWATNSSHQLPTDLESARIVVVAPKIAWPLAGSASVTVKVGAPSKEGPLTTTAETANFFAVVPKFSIRGLACDNLDEPRRKPTCPASGAVSVVLSTPIDRRTLRDDMFQVVGEKPVVHPVIDDRLRFPTPAAVGKEFTIKVAATGLRDLYGQALVEPRDQTFTTTKPRAIRPDPWVGAHASSDMFILDPRFAVPQWIVDTQAIGGLHVELYRVEPRDYFAYTDFASGKRKTPPGKKLLDKTYAVGAGFGGTLRQDLRPALDANGTGHVIVVASATPAIPQENLRQYAWIQVTKLGLTARYDGSNVHAWVDSIATDASFLHPVAQVATSLVVQGRTDVAAPVATDADGQATFALPERLPAKVVETPGGDDEEQDEPQRPAIVVARRGTESVFTSIDAAQKATRRDFARWYVTDDRFTYRPGEPVFVKGWLRWTHDGIDPDIRTQPGAIAWTLRDARGTKLATGTAPVSDQGGFDLEAQLPETAQLGRAQFTFSTPIPGSPKDVDAYTLNIAVEEFRTPAFAVTMNDDVTHTGATPLYAGESIAMATSASYFGGGGLGGAKVTWSAHLEPTTYHPPGWPAFRFEPGVRAATSDDGFSFRARARESGGLTVDAPTQLSGAASSNVVIAVPAVPFAEPAMLSVDATVTDVDRQTIRGSSRAILVHPSAYYVGGRVKPGANLQGGELELIVTDVDGQAVAGVPIEVVIEGVTYARGNPVDAQACTVTSAAAGVTCAFQRKDVHHRYRAFARVVDGRGRASTTMIDVPWWVSQDADFAISADKPSYRVGDVAKLTVRSTTVPATAVVTYARQGVIAQRRVALAQEKTIVELPIEAAWVENVHVLVERRGASTTQADPAQTVPLPAYEEAAIDLPIELDSVRLAMTTRPLRKVLEPGAEAAFEVTVAKDGKPVANAEVALMVVDEAILSLSSRTHGDPLPRFYATVEAGVLSLETFGLITDAGEDLAGAPGWERFDLSRHGFMVRGGTGSGYGSGRGGMRGRTAGAPSVAAGVVARKDFRATAVFSPRLHTDADGKVTLTVKMPDSLTRFRVVALATANNRWFGKAENTVLVQLPINARTMPPRFLTQGDTFALPVVVQNLDRKPRTVSVAVRAANLTATAPGQRVTLAAGQRAEVRFPMATTARGLAAIQTIVASDATTAVDANTTLVQVYEPATTESFATYGVVDGEPQFEQLAVPTEIYPEVGGVEAEVSSTQLSSLTDAYWYLYAYPYECAEQRSARMLATTAMFDVLEAFATPNRPKRAEIEATRARDLAKLAKDQNDDGGWNFYPKMKSDPFITQQVLAALVAASDQGAATTSAIAYVKRDVAGRLASLEQLAKQRVGERRDAGMAPYLAGVVAASLVTLASAGVDVKPQAQRLHAAATTLGAYPIDAKARVLALLAKQPRYARARATLLADVLGSVRETAAGATIVARFVEAERLLFGSNTKTTALALDALIREVPDHAVIAKLARGVLDARAHGRWISTQENLVVLQAMRKYFDTYEKATPNYTGKLWFGAAAYAEQAFVGRSSARGRVTIDWPTLGLGKTHDLTLAKAGVGRMYYRVGITYAPKQAILPAMDAGFIVRRSYTGVDNPGDVTALPNGQLKVKLGARVLVQLEVLNTTRRNVVGLADPMPAGFEPVNTRLANAERAAAAVTDGWDYTNLRDERAEGFASSLPEGTHHYAYTVRATTPGVFVVAPAKAEEMYAPETFGRSASVTVTVE